MCFVLISWLIMFAAFCGSGWLIFEVAGTGRNGNPVSKCICPFELFWCGLGVTVAAAQVWHFFLPLNETAFLVWLLFSAGGLALYLWRLYETRKETSSSARLAVARLMFVFCAIYCLYMGAAGVATERWSRAYDTDLYHFNALRWMNEYAIVPGLGNLHARLAHTSGFLTISALCDNLWWDGATAWLTGGLLVCVTVLLWLRYMILPPDGTCRVQRLFCLFTLPYLLGLLTNIRPSLYYDDAAKMAQLVLVLAALRWLPCSPQVSCEDRSGGSAQIYHLVIFSFMGVLSFSIKSTGAVALLFTIIFVFYILRDEKLRCGTSIRQSMTKAAIVAFIPALMLAGHLARNLILSGWLAFPAPVGKGAFLWTMPRTPSDDSHIALMQSVEGQYAVIKAWARMPGAENLQKVMQGGTQIWFSDWLQRNWNGAERWLLSAGLVAWLLFFVFKLWKRRYAYRWEAALLLLIFALANLVFWFCSAPDLRFGRAFFWILSGSGFSLLLSQHDRKNVRQMMILFVAAFFFRLSPASLIAHKPQSWRRTGRASSRAVRTVILQNGQTPALQLYVPMRGDQAGDTQLPSTPYPQKQLQLRRAGDLQSGFYLAPSQ